MDDYQMFSCKDCHYVTLAVIANHRRCNHPCIAEVQLEGTGRRTFTKSDWKKIYILVNETLNLQITLIDGKVTNFDWPFKYEPIWITSCDGFKPSTRVKGYNKETGELTKGQIVDNSMGD